MKSFNEAIKILTEEFENRLISVSTAEFDLSTNPKGRNSKKDRSKWADNVVSQLYKKDRDKITKRTRRLESGEYNFSYIKFAENKKKEVFAVVHGKSSFHCMYPSDVWFYEIDESKPGLKNLFDEYDLKWHTDKILIIKNINELDSKEAYSNEKIIKKMLNTFD